jgi:hypothetical protein
LFNIVESFENFDNPLTTLRARVVSCVLGALKVIIENVVVETSKRAP